MAKNITSANFQSEVNKEGKLLLDFWATWCGPCQRQGPIIDEMANEGFNVGKVNVDEEPGLAQQFSVMSIPTLILFENGKEVKRLVGLNSKEALTELMK